MRRASRPTASASSLLMRSASDLHQPFVRERQRSPRARALPRAPLPSRHGRRHACRCAPPPPRPAPWHSARASDPAVRPSSKKSDPRSARRGMWWPCLLLLTVNELRGRRYAVRFAHLMIRARNAEASRQRVAAPTRCRTVGSSACVVFAFLDSRDTTGEEHVTRAQSRRQVGHGDTNLFHFRLLHFRRRDIALAGEDCIDGVQSAR